MCVCVRVCACVKMRSFVLAQWLTQACVCVCVCVLGGGRSKREAGLCGCVLVLSWRKADMHVSSVPEWDMSQGGDASYVITFVDVATAARAVRDPTLVKRPWGFQSSAQTWFSLGSGHVVMWSCGHAVMLAGG